MSTSIATLLFDAYQHAVAAVEPASAVASHLTANPPAGDRIRIIAIGKAAPAMCRGAAQVLGGRLVGGVAVSDHEETVPAGIELMIGSHPFPDAASLRAGRRILEEAASSDHDALLVLVSGGGSALAEVPAGGLGIEDLAATQKALMNAGVPIEGLNTVRRHLSILKHGGVARVATRPLTSILISDVIDAPASAIASGPTLADATTPADAAALIRDRGLDVPGKVLEHLDTAPVSTPPPDHDWVTVADGASAARAAASFLRASGVEARVVTTRLRGETQVEALAFVAATLKGEVAIAAGETTVHVAGTGSGGRNQHAALAVAIDIEGRAETVFAALGTDGIDGPTPAAGAIVDGSTASRIRQAGVDPGEALARCDSHPALDAAGALVVTGPTGTNVGDLWLAWQG